MTKNSTQAEARRLLNNLSSMPGFHSTTTAEVVDFMCENYSMTVFCCGQLRNITCSPITSKSYSITSEAA